MRFVLMLLGLASLSIACKREVATTALDAALVVPQKTEAELGGQYWVIVSSKEESGANPPALEKLRAHPDLGVEITRLQSSRFKNLKPCLEVIIAGAFAAKDRAVALSSKLRELGIDNYVKNAGAYVGAGAKVDAYCADKKEPPPLQGTCGSLAFVEVWNGRVFMEVTADRRSDLKPTMLDFRAWTATIAATQVGDTKVGDKVRLFDTDTVAAIGICTITRFVDLTRGTPHFSYSQNEEGMQIDPTAPGCGSPETFAELQCPATPENANLYAWPVKGPAPLVFELKPHLAELESMALAEVAKAPGYRDAYKGAEQEAKARNAALKVDHKVRTFVNGKRTLVLIDTLLSTGEGNNNCGAEDVRVDVRGMFELDKNNKMARTVFPVHAIETSEVDGVVDLNADDHIELFERRFPDRREVVGEGGEPACQIEIPFCDCPC